VIDSPLERLGAPEHDVLRSWRVKKAPLVLLVVVVLLTGAPVLMGNAHGTTGMDSASGVPVECPDCGPGVMTCTITCAALLALAVGATLAVLGVVRAGDPRRRPLLLASGLFHPPRLA
jgi:hypothetical protein